MENEAGNPQAQDIATLVLADSHPVVLHGIESILSGESVFRVVDTCVNGDDALRAVQRHRPDILFLDPYLPGKDGLTLIAEILESGFFTKIVLFTAAIDEECMCHAIRLGVRGVLFKESPAHLIPRCLRRVHEGGEWLERCLVGKALEKMLRRDEARQRLARDLGPRELAVALLASHGDSNKAIAEALHLGEGSVKTYLHRIYHKLGLHSRLALARELKHRGLVE
jgi:DNA-binding NarL/FixJ family response regulator